ncbi:unnamed protein product [Notodromas monacha]|uniref:ZP domain-containing protein n=1 Tax=Notodromas monacha TaxID=399045 RepID=A0A7R9G9J9_9CRUS|nr:unnamed protein product [Notodromas monacha]CAG0912983.1 unnamed protein product [Notodromas monacha]
MSESERRHVELESTRLTKNMSLTLILRSIVWLALHGAVFGEKQTWEKDLSSQMKIEVSTDGFDSIRVDCSKDSMEVTVLMEEDFDGVLYTRGNFYDQTDSCFLDASGGRKFELSLPFRKCAFKKENETYTATLVVQHDDFLIFPGDLAFELRCDMNPQEFVVSGKLSGPEEVPKETSTSMPSASIGLANPDPAGASLPKHQKSTISSKDGVAIFTPGDVRPRKKVKLEKQIDTVKGEGKVFMEKLEL